MVTEEKKPGDVKIEAGEVSPKQMEEIETGEYLTVPQIATRLSYTRAHIQKLIKQGRIKGIKPMGGRWRVPKSEFERLLKEGIPPLPREEVKPPVTEIVVEDKKIIDKVKEPKRKEEEKRPPGMWPFNFTIFGGKE